MIIRKFHISFFLILLTVCFDICVGAQKVWSANLEEIKKLDQQVLQQKKKIGRVQTGINTHEDRVQDAKEREINLLTELMRINQQILDESKKLSTLKEKMDRQDQLTKDKEVAMQHLLLEKQTLEEHTKTRLAAYYRMGDIGIMNVTFSSSSLPDLLAFQENFHHMLKYDQQVINAFKNKMVELDKSRQEHNAEKERLALIVEEVQEQQKALTATKQERRKLLARVKTERKLYQRAISEMEAATKELAATLVELEKTASEAKEERETQRIKDYPLKPFKKRRPASARGFAALKGQLHLPISGAILQTFGKHTNTTFDVSSFTNGIDIEASPSAEIKAVYEGKIVYAGTLRGYGKLIIIDHGNNYFTLVSGIGEIDKKVGDTVRQHERVGIASIHTGLLQEGLHFEIRHKSQALDPLEWVDTSKISFKNQ